MTFSLHGLWDNLTAWTILLQRVAVICLQFWEFRKSPKIEKCGHSFQRLDLDPNSRFLFLDQPKLHPGMSPGAESVKYIRRRRWIRGGGGAGMLTSPQIPTAPFWGGTVIPGKLIRRSDPSVRPIRPTLRLSAAFVCLPVCLRAWDLGPWACGPKRIHKYRQDNIS